MKKILILLYLLCYTINALANVISDDNSTKISREQNTTSKINPLPYLGTCSDYSDYYISQCQPFKCEFPMPKNPGVYREMTTLGYHDNKCIHIINYRVRHDDFRPADIKVSCRLSEDGKKAMAKLFTRYKNGDITAYTSTKLGPILKKECR